MEERTNYPLTLSVDDFGEGFQLTAQTQAPIVPHRVCDFMQVALERLVDTLRWHQRRPRGQLTFLVMSSAGNCLSSGTTTVADYSKGRLLHDCLRSKQRATLTLLQSSSRLSN